jgi:cytochrome c
LGKLAYSTASPLRDGLTPLDEDTDYQLPVMRRLLFFLLLPTLMLFGCHHQPPGTKEEAKAMALRAADYLKKVGPDKAFPAFNTSSHWRDRDLYVFVFDRTGVLKASGAFQQLIGQKQLDVPDKVFKLYVREIVGIKDQGWVEYWYWSPIDHLGYKKSSYCVRVGDYVIGAGAYDYSSGSRPSHPSESRPAR